MTDVTGTEVIVFAAGSLVDAFTEIGARYEQANPGCHARFVFASADHLRERIRQGEIADVFASANVRELERAQADGLLAGLVHVFAHNRLQLIVSRESAGRIRKLADLVQPGIRLAAEHAGAPLSGYTRELLARVARDPTYGADFAERFAANAVVQVATVRELVARVAEAVADAGIVYLTDVTSAARPRIAVVEIPNHLNITADYAIAAVANAQHPGRSRDGLAFVELVRSPEGQAILEQWGFARGDSPDA
jgi:molybdate transport system substrate-binding protein